MKLLKLKRDHKFTEENVLNLLEENEYISASMIQHRFNVGYGKAAMMIDLLAEKGYVMHDGHRWIKVK